jgi:hypothetical protein
MKTLLCSLFILITLNACAQNPKISGEIYLQEDYLLGETLTRKASFYELYFSNDSCADASRKLFKKGSGYQFDFKISKSKLKKYKFLHIKVGDAYQCFKLQSILNIRQKVIFQSSLQNDPETIVKKPAIYLYPTQKQEVTVLHDFKGQILTTYPEYNQGWHVIAYPDGKIVNRLDQREYAYLFWDGAFKFPNSHFQFDDGFIVSKSDNIAFLQEKLNTLGLNNTEINDFIVFWLPLLNANDQNFIHFRFNDNIDQSSILNIDPQPDTLIRVFMEFKPMKNDETMSVKEQVLPKLIRNGFTVVEWGGAELSKVNLISENIE